MKILYSSAHSVLEYDELRLLTEMDGELEDKFDIEVFSMGAYMNPTQSGDYLRSVIPKGKFYPDLYGVGIQCSNDLIHPELIEWADVWLCMHNSSVPGQQYFQRWIVNNFYRFKKEGKKVIWRSIGQSTPDIEKELSSYFQKGLQIIRYSELEKSIPNYCGASGTIPFYKDENEFNNWTGQKKVVITIAQSFKKRGEHLGYNTFERVTNGFSRKVYGTENADLGDINGGSPSYEELKRILRESRVLFYYGTQPAPYTLTFIEALMTGIPIVAVGEKLRDTGIYKWPHYEIPQIIHNGVNGYVSDDIEELRGYVDLLLSDQEVAKRIGEAGRKTALDLYSRNKVMRRWADYFKVLNK